MKTNLFFLVFVLIFTGGVNSTYSQNHNARHVNYLHGNNVRFYYDFQNKIDHAYMNYLLTQFNRSYFINRLISLRKLEINYWRDGYLTDWEARSLQKEAGRIENRFYSLVRRNYNMRSLYPYNSSFRNSNRRNYGYRGHGYNDYDYGHYGHRGNGYRNNGNRRNNNRNDYHSDAYYGKNKGNGKASKSLKRQANTSSKNSKQMPIPSIKQGNQKKLDDIQLEELLIVKNSESRSIDEKSINWEKL